MAQRTPHHHPRPSPYPTSSELRGLSQDSPRSHRENRAASPFSSSPFPPSQREFAADLSNGFSASHSSVGFGPNPLTAFPRTSGVDTAQYITKFGSLFGLDDDRLHQAHKFHKYLPDAETKIAVAHVQSLYIAQRVEQLSGNVEGILSKLTEVEEYVKAAWALSPAQEEALKMLLGNYLLRPMVTYKKVVDAAMEYVAQHRSKYGLAHFSTEEVVKATVKLFLRSKINDIKSAFRKALWKRVHCGLETLTDSMISDFHFNPAGVKDRSRIKAVLALQRKVALPISARGKNVRGADTGFWAALEKELKVLVVKNGSDRSGAKWMAWERDIVSEDLTLHNSVEYGLGDDRSEGEDDDEDDVPAGSVAIPRAANTDIASP
ncbi:hypothetical protein C8R47DRAFT_1323416 [Mycena vitilis]|nr:hypothetical protein C8R47DRAFT_1323416 [Mycena vitilis]